MEFCISFLATTAFSKLVEYKEIENGLLWFLFLVLYGSFYDLRQGNDSRLPRVHTTTYGIETISFFGNRLWSTLPNIIKQQAHFLFSKAILNVGRARTATVDFAKYIYHRLGTYHDVYQCLFFILYM